MLSQQKEEPSPPLFLLLLLLLEFLQVFLGHLDDVAGLLLWSEDGRGKGGGASVQRGASGGPGQTLPQVLAHGLALQKLRSETSTHETFSCFVSLRAGCGRLSATTTQQRNSATATLLPGVLGSPELFDFLDVVLDHVADLFVALTYKKRNNSQFSKEVQPDPEPARALHTARYTPIELQQRPRQRLLFYFDVR